MQERRKKIRRSLSGAGFCRFFYPSPSSFLIWVFLVLSMGFLLLIFPSCSLRAGVNQLRLGIWAAEHDLWDEAIFRWKKALEKEPNSAILHNNLAVAYEKKGLWEEARKEYELALKLAPEHQYIKANYRFFQDNLKAAERPEKKEGKKEERKEEKGKGKERD